MTIAEPFLIKFEALFLNPKHRETFNQLIRQTPSLATGFSKFLARAAGSTNSVFTVDGIYKTRNGKRDVKAPFEGRANGFGASTIKSSAAGSAEKVERGGGEG